MNNKVGTRPTLRTQKVLKNRQSLLKKWRHEDLKSSQLQHLKSPNRASKCSALQKQIFFIRVFITIFLTFQNVTSVRQKETKT